MENQTIAKEKNDIEKHYPYDIGLALSGGGAAVVEQRDLPISELCRHWKRRV